MSDKIIQQARLDAVAVVRAALNNDEPAIELLLNLSPDPREMAHAACGLAASLLALLEPEQRQRILDGMTAAALATPDGAP